MDNFSDVYLRVKSSISSQYYDFGIALGIPPGVLGNIKEEPKRALSNVLQEWLKQNYNTDKHGLPTWQKLVEAVDNPAGGNNHVLAKAIASEHLIGIPHFLFVAIWGAAQCSLPMYVCVCTCLQVIERMICHRKKLMH